MEFDTDIKIISRELVAEGFTKRVDCRYYWDSHGNKVWDFQPADSFKYSEPKKFELYREIREYHFEYVPTQIWEFLFLYIDGEKIDVGEIASFEELKTKVKLQCCVGAG
jgi:hypothetical protein